MGPREHHRLGGIGRALSRPSMILSLVALLIVNLFVVGLSGFVLMLSHQQQRHEAILATDNLSRELNENLLRLVDKIDLTLLAVVDEAERQMSAGGIDRPLFEAVLARHDGRLPEALGLRVTNAQGRIEYALHNVATSNNDVSDRQHFIRQRDDPNAGLFIASPLIGRLSVQHQIALSRRYRAADGSFAGIVEVAVAINSLKTILSAIDVGPRGNVALWDGRPRLLLRQSQIPIPDMEAASPSSRLAGLISNDAGPTAFHTRSGADGVERVFFFRKVGRWPLYLVVGLADDDVMVGWWREVAYLSGLTGLFMLGSIVAFVAFHRSRQALQASEERYRTVFQTSLDVVNINRLADGTLVDVNPAFVHALGYERDEVIGNSALELNLWVDPRDRQTLFEELIRNSTCTNLEAQFRKKNGETVWGLISASVIEIDGIPSILAITRDVTERKLATQALAESENRFRRFFEANGSVMLLVEGPDGAIVAANRAAAAFYGYAPERMTGMPLTRISNLTREETTEMLQEGLREGCSYFTCRHQLASGEERDVEIYASPVEMDGRPVLFSIVHDITEKKQAEAMLLQSQKMEAIGTLAGGIAHDFNNILAVILGFTQLILLDPRNPDELVEYARKIQSSGNRAKELVRQILTFSRQAPSNRTPIDLCQALNEVYQLVRPATPTTIEIALELPPDRAMVLGSATELHQVLMNLCVNAVDAIGNQHGRISIVLARRDGGLDLSVTDSGCGIPKVIRSKIFDPFFTTKGVGKGTGLGLSVALSIVEHLGGTISVESPSEGGTRFVVRLPELASNEIETVAPKSLPPVQATVQAWHILVVDDEPHIVEVLRRFFERKGHRVSATTISKEALGWIRKGERFDLVITDQTMPEVTGIELARAIAECTPDAKVLLCSGRDDTLDEHDIAAAHIRGFVLKPLDLTELADTVERLLEAAHAEI
jgi:PAS domain S-box-containing protein